MGFDFFKGFSKADLRAYLDREYWGRENRVLRSKMVGNILWQVVEFDRGENHEPRYTRHIICHLLAHNPGFGWGFKSMDESMHPYSYTCPLEFLDLTEEESPEWRQKVREYNRQQKVQQKVAKAILQNLQVGDMIQLAEGYKPERLRIVSLKPLRGMAENGKLYSIPRRAIA